MPSRIVRDGILTSLKVDKLSSGAEIFYRRILNVVDDFGRYHGTPSLLRAAAFPLKVDKVLDSHINIWVKECASAGLIETYLFDGLPYIEVLNFGVPRAKQSKFKRLQADENKCLQMKADASNGTVVVVESVVVSETTLPTALDKPKRRSWAGDWEPTLAKLLVEQGTAADRCKLLNHAGGIAGKPACETLLRELEGRQWVAKDCGHAYAYLTSALKAKVAPAAQNKVSVQYQRGDEAYGN